MSQKSGLHISLLSIAGAVGKPEVETDRARFLGRSRSVRTVIAGDRMALLLSNTVGTVLDGGLRPAPARGSRPVRSCTSPFWTVVASSR